MKQLDSAPRAGTRYAPVAALVLLGLAIVAFAWRPLLATDGFLPHGVCYTWQPGLIRLHLISDVLIGLAYFSIPVALVYFMRKRRDLPFSWMFLLFGLFIVACGATHWMEVWTLWYPQYWLSGVVKAVTAAASVPTAIALALLIPRALAIPSLQQLREAKDALEVEVVERRRAEIALREAQATLEHRVEERTAALAEAREQAEAANCLKDEFLATVSHELRSPLNSMVGWLHVLGNAAPGAPEARNAIDRIRRSVDVQTRLISDLLDLSRIVTGKLRLEMRRLDPVLLLEDAVQSLRAAATAKRIELTLTAEPTGVLIAGDPDRLGQVVWNLLSNALKFTPEGGRIEVTLKQAGTRLHIAVADTGEGIDPALLPHVFERFRQGEAGNRRAQGLGVGLAVVQHIVEMHGGSVQAHSAGRGHGATFTIKLPIPALTGTGEERHSAALPPVQLNDVRVLVVDDEVEARDVLRSALSVFGAQVHAVDSIDAAIETLSAWQPHVLVSDLGLAGEDGYTLIRRVRSLEAAGGGRIPAVALTALSRPEDRLRALAAGFQMHVAKPVEPQELALVIASLIGRLPAGAAA
jgi:signal transduction histidine kinase/ActR/RegA family two-component response regulator